MSIEWSHIECSHRVLTHTLHFVFIFTLFGVSCRDNFFREDVLATQIQLSALAETLGMKKAKLLESF